MGESFLPPPRQFNTAAVDMHVEWRTWINSFHIYSQAIELEKKSNSIQTATMLHCLGPSVQRIYETLPDKKDTFKEAEKTLEQYFAPKRNVVAERYKFRSRKQNSDEPIDAYLSSLRELAKACEFGEFEDEMIRDQIVEKCHSTNLKERLLAQDSLDLAKTIRIARSNEYAVQETRLLTGLGTKDGPINIDRIKEKPQGDKKSSTCYKCGGAFHAKYNDCPAINIKCNNCKKVGHYARVCRSKARGQNSKSRSRTKQKRHRKIRAIKQEDWLEEETDSDDVEPVLYVNNKDNSVQIELNGRKIRMIINTGSVQNIISSELYHSQFKVYQLMKTSKKFTAYGQRNHLNCLGYFKASLRAGMKTISSKIYVIQGQAEALLGRNACIELGVIRQVMPIKVDSNVNQKTKTCFDNLIEEYNDIFTGLGKIGKFEHKISVNPNVKPVSQKLRRIPFGQIESVDREIDKMLNDGVIEEATQPSPWVSNLVVVPKSSGGCDLRELNKAVVRERH